MKRWRDEARSVTVFEREDGLIREVSDGEAMMSGYEFVGSSGTSAWSSNDVSITTTGGRAWVNGQPRAVYVGAPAGTAVTVLEVPAVHQENAVAWLKRRVREVTDLVVA